MSRLRRSCIETLLTCAIAASFPQVAVGQAAPNADAGGTSPGTAADLFNGKDLTGWKEFGSKNGWSVLDGVLYVSPGEGWLGTDREYSDFEFEVEYRLEAGGNSGVFIHASDKGSPEGNGFLEVQLQDDEAPRLREVPENRRNGSIYGMIARSDRARAPANKWNRLSIKVVGPQVTVHINGTKVLDASLDDYKTELDARPGFRASSGRLGLQRHRSSAEFRHIRIRDLASASRPGDNDARTRVEAKRRDRQQDAGRTAAGDAIIYPAPAGEPLSDQCTVLVNGKTCPVYAAKVGPAADNLRWKTMNWNPDASFSVNVAETGNYFDMASFVYFDMRSPVTVTVTPTVPVQSARVFPTSFSVKPTIRGNQISLTIPKPMNFSLEVNGDSIHTLHLFANPLETDVPQSSDPNVIYFGPGVHEVTHIEVGDKKTLYVAGGAVLRGRIGPEERKTFVGGTYEPTIVLSGTNSRVRGRGIIDASLCPTHSRYLLAVVRGRSATVEGVIFRDAQLSALPIYHSQGVEVDNVKILNRRVTADGIDVVNSDDVTIERCFTRTMDDNISIKTYTDRELANFGYVARPDEPTITGSRRIVVKDCVLWAEYANAFIIGPEIRQDVTDVLVKNCDIIHNKGRCSELRIENSDNGRAQNVRFQNIRVDESRRLITLIIEKNMWSSRDNHERGHIQDVSFEDIRATAGQGLVELRGFDDAHAIENVTFRRVFINSKPLTRSHGTVNSYVKGIQPSN